MTKIVEDHRKILGMKAEDCVTGWKGIVTSICYDLYGCIQAIITPQVDDKSTYVEGRWFDVKRLKIIDKNIVMEVPDFHSGYVATGKKGASEKPLP